MADLNVGQTRTAQVQWFDQSNGTVTDTAPAT